MDSYYDQINRVVPMWASVEELYSDKGAFARVRIPAPVSKKDIKEAVLAVRGVAVRNDVEFTTEVRMNEDGTVIIDITEVK